MQWEYNSSAINRHCREVGIEKGYTLLLAYSEFVMFKGIEMVIDDH